MSILEQIVKAKRRDIERYKQTVPVALLEKSEYFQAGSISLEKSLLNEGGHGIIAEFKRQSPSRGVINSLALAEEVCPFYLRSGASAVSVLTNGEFFGGSNEDLLNARRLCKGPILRKEFIIDEYQVVESKSIGADAILLIADILSAGELEKLSGLARLLDMEVLFEIHDENGIKKLPAGARLVGVNSRNLGNFSVDMDILKKTADRLPPASIKVAESGIGSVEALIDLKKEGFRGFLIGELFMRDQYPGKACENFINNLKKLQPCK
jgi:indole-3-glycerol phosphate synthase